MQNVYFGSSRATIVGEEFNEIVAKAPANESAVVPVTVVTAYGTSAVSPKSYFKYEAPIVTSVTPKSGSSAGGTKVTVEGAGFGASTTFIFGKTKASNVECGSTTRCTMVAPSAAKMGSVDVVAVGSKTSKKTASDRYAYT